MNPFRRPEAQRPAPPPPEDRWGAPAEDGTREWTAVHAEAGMLPVRLSERVDVVLAHGYPETAMAGHVEWFQPDSPRQVRRWRLSVPLSWWGVEHWVRR